MFKAYFPVDWRNLFLFDFKIIVAPLMVLMVFSPEVLTKFTDFFGIQKLFFLKKKDFYFEYYKLLVELWKPSRK